MPAYRWIDRDSGLTDPRRNPVRYMRRNQYEPQADYPSQGPPAYSRRPPSGSVYYGEPPRTRYMRTPPAENEAEEVRDYGPAPEWSDAPSISEPTAGPPRYWSAYEPREPMPPEPYEPSDFRGYARAPSEDHRGARTRFVSVQDTSPRTIAPGHSQTILGPVMVPGGRDESDVHISAYAEFLFTAPEPLGTTATYCLARCQVYRDGAPLEAVGYASATLLDPALTGVSGTMHSTVPIVWTDAPPNAGRPHEYRVDVLYEQGVMGDSLVSMRRAMVLTVEP